MPDLSPTFVPAIPRPLPPAETPHTTVSPTMPVLAQPGGQNKVTTMTSPTTKPVTKSQSTLAASLPSIVNMLNSPIQPAELKQGVETVTVSPQTAGVVHSPPQSSLAAVTPASTITLSVSPVKTRTTAVTTPKTVTATVTLGGQFALQTLSGSSGQSVISITPQASSPEDSSLATPAQGQFGVTSVVTHNIPRVIPGDPDKDSVGPMTIGKGQPVTPDRWTVFDVCQFLRINDCGAYSDSFRKKVRITNLQGPAAREVRKSLS